MSTHIDFSIICRTCLSIEDLLPIFKNMECPENFLDILFIITDTKMRINDGLPQNICKNCLENVNNTIKFRNKCKDTERQLLIMKEELDKYHTKESLESCHTESDTNTENTEFLKIAETKQDETGKDQLINDLENKSNNITCKKRKINPMKETKSIDHVLYELDEADPQQRRVICKLCQKKLSIRSLWSHIARRHPGADDRRVKCELCDDYVLKEKLNRHKTLMHGDQFRCRYCKGEFGRSDLLAEHVATCSVKKKRKAPEYNREIQECDICHKSMQKASLKVHKAVKHAGLAPVCEHCGKTFGNKLRLDEHCRAKHGYDKLKCCYCHFLSSSHVALRNHERRHRGEKPFVCESCGAGFHAAYLLAQHRHSHRTDRRFKCSECPASFKANNSLHAHRRGVHARAAHAHARAADT